MKASDIPNFAFGHPVGMTTEQFLVFNRFLTFTICLSSSWYASQTVRVSKISVSFLWLLYFFVLVVFTTTGWISGDVTSYAFLSMTIIHVYTEFLIAIRTLESKPHMQDLWARRGTPFYIMFYFLTMNLWQPMNFLALGSILSLPTDLLNLPAAWILMRRTKDRMVWWFGFFWFVHCPLAYAIMGCLIWGANAENNYAGTFIMPVHACFTAQAICLAFCYRKLDPDVVGDPAKEDPGAEELGLLAAKNIEKPGDLRAPGMMWGIKMVNILLIIFIGPSTLTPFFLGYININQVMFNACDHYYFGEVQTLRNVGPHFIWPIDCKLDPE